MSTPYQEKRREAILAAANVFANKGYHGASTSDIAKALGIRQASLYYYFRSKEEALEEVCLLAMESYLEGLMEIMDKECPFTEKLEAVIRLHLGKYRQGTEALKVHNEQRFYLPLERRERIRIDGRRYRENLQRLFQEQVIAGFLTSRTDCLFAAQSTIELCNAWGGRIFRDESIDLDLLSHKCMRLILRGVGYDDL